MRLLERDQQLRALTEYADEAGRGEGRLVLVSGEAGAGKSALLESFEAARPDLHVAWGTCDGGFTPRPLGPVADLATSLPEPLAGALEPEADRHHLFSALLATAADRAHPVALVIEDLHWADDATLDLVRFLGRRLWRSGGLVLASYRDDEVAPDAPLRLVLGQLASERCTRRIGVPVLSPAGVAALARGADVDPAGLHALTGGNPYFVTEVLRDPGGPLPASARDAVLARLAVLRPDVRRCVEAAAVAGAPVDTTTLAAVRPAGVEGLDEAVDRGLLVADDHRLRFRHELSRLAVLEAVPGHRRVALHRDLLDALAACGDADHALLAHHAEGARDAAAVQHHAPRAAAAAHRLAAHREAAEQLQRALRWVDDDGARAALLDDLGLQLSVLDRWEEAHQTRIDALETWRRLGRRDREGLTLAALSRTHWRLLHGEDADAAAASAVQVLDALGPSPELARALVAAAGTHMLHGRTEAACAAAERALALGERLGLADVVADALDTRACALHVAGEEWRGDMERAVSVAVGTGLVEQAGRAWVNLYSCLKGDLRYAEAEGVFSRAWDYCQERDVPTYGSCLLGERVEVLVELGRWAEAREVAGALSRLEHLSPINRLHDHLAMALVAVRAGDADAAARVAEVSEEAGRNGEPQWLLPVGLCRAELAWQQGDDEAARRVLEELAPLARAVAPGPRGALAAWRCRTGLGAVPDGSVAGLPAPVVAALRGQHDLAARAWEGLGCGHQAALALLDGDDAAGWRRALELLEAMGAAGTAGGARRRLRAAGHGAVHHGRRRSTVEHPLGLTRRQQEVLDLLADGLTNDQIAARLVISAKTVDHHVSAVLARLGVGDRRAAAALAASRDGESAGAT